jgi:hypothetical protein
MGREERASQARREEENAREMLLREGLLHIANGVARIGNALAVTIVATYPMGDEPDERGMVDVKTFNYTAYRSDTIGIPHLEQAETIIRDARTNLIFKEHEPGSGGVEVDGDAAEQFGAEALREAEGDDGDGDPDGAHRRPGHGDEAGPDAPHDSEDA